MAEDFGPNPEELRAIAKGTGCRVARTRRAHDGAHVYELACDSHAGKVQLLAALASYDAADGRVRRIAEQVAGRGNALAQLRRLLAFVQRSVRFQWEPVETFQHTLRTLELGYGDCDDSARAVGALAASIGYRVGLGTLSDPQGYPVHVAAMVEIGGTWLWLETTMAAYLGEHPLAAARRLGVQTRPDLVAGT